MKIRLFDSFVIETDRKLFMNELIPKQSLSLLEVFIVRYGSTVTSNELMQMFWEDSDNPLNALKFGIHRLRKILKSIPGLETYELIRTEKGGYRFDPGIICEIDCYELSSRYEEWHKNKIIDFSNIESLEKANAVYRGNLFNITDNFYLKQKSAYYRNAYLEICDALCTFYLKHGLNENLMEVSLRAATLEPSVEDNHFYYLQSLIQTHQYTAAFEYYQMVYKMLMREYELSLSTKMTNLYDCIVQNKDKQENMIGIMDYYDNKKIEDGAFFCDNTAFDYIYEINIRNAKRNDQSYYVLMFEIKTDKEEKRLEGLQEKLKFSLQSSLRKGDVFTKLNKYQFLALLPCPDEKLAFNVVQRIVRLFKKKAQRKEDSLHYFIREANTDIEEIVNENRRTDLSKGIV